MKDARCGVKLQEANIKYVENTQNLPLGRRISWKANLEIKYMIGRTKLKGAIFKDGAARHNHQGTTTDMWKEQRARKDAKTQNLEHHATAYEIIEHHGNQGTRSLIQY